MVRQAALCGGVCQLPPTRQILLRQQSRQRRQTITIDNQNRHVSELLVRRIYSHQQSTPHPGPSGLSRYQSYVQTDETLESTEVPFTWNQTSFATPNVNASTFGNNNPGWQNFLQPTQEQSFTSTIRQNNLQSYQTSYNEQRPHFYDNSSSQPNPESAMIRQGNEYFPQITQTPWQQQFHVRPRHQIPQFSVQDQRPQNAVQQFHYPPLPTYEQIPDNLSRQAMANSDFGQIRSQQPIINPTPQEPIYDQSNIQSIPLRPTYNQFSEDISGRQAAVNRDFRLNQRPVQYQQVHYPYHQVQSDVESNSHNPMYDATYEAVAIRQQYLRDQLANTSSPAQIDFSRIFQDPSVGNAQQNEGQQFSNWQNNQPLYGLTPQPSVFVEPQQSVCEQNSQMFHERIPEQAVDRHERIDDTQQLF